MTKPVLIIYTGGTIGMVNDPETGALCPFNFDQIACEVPEIKEFGVTIDSYTLPEIIDSSDLQPQLWKDLCSIILKNYDDYRGFVILHGTDTMAYSAAALSFMLNNLTKPVIFTGSQLPIGKIRTDGNSLIITPLREDNFNFSDLLLEDLIMEGYEGEELLKEFRLRTAKIKPALKEIIKEAETNTVTTKDIFGDDF